MLQAEEALPVIAHVCALEDACIVPELAALVNCKLQPAVRVPEPAAASDSRASASRTRMLRAAAAAAATTPLDLAKARRILVSRPGSSSDGKENRGRSKVSGKGNAPAGGRRNGPPTRKTGKSYEQLKAKKTAAPKMR